jgi:hypothetical protein
VGEQRLDNKGDIFYRLSTENDRIHRISPTGTEDILHLDAGGQDVAISGAGSVFQLGNTNERREAWISEFDPSGTRISHVVLRPQSEDSWILGLRVVRFSSGRFLVLGYQFAKDTGKASTLMGVFDEEGFQIGDIHFSGRAARAQTLGVGTNSFFDAASLGAVPLDAQGDSAYIVLPGADRPLLTIDSSGEITGILPLNPSQKNLQLTNFRVNGQRALLTLRGSINLPDGRPTIGVIYEVYDLKSRKLISSFHEMNFIGDVASFDGDEEFTTFVSLPDRRYLMHLNAGARR